MSERKILTITQVDEIKKVGDKQIPKLAFKAKDGDKESLYFTFRSSLFELIKQGQTITADVDIEERGEYTNRKIVQIYLDGQPIVGKGQYRGKSPEELDQTAKSMALSYAKDLAVAKLLSLEEITKWANTFYVWLKGNGDKPVIASPDRSGLPPKSSLASPAKTSETDEDWEEIGKEKMPSGQAIPNVSDLKGLLMSHKIPTHEAYEILSIKSYDELKDLDEAWDKIKKAKKI